MKYISKDNLALYDNLIKDYVKNKAQNLQEIFAYGVQWSEDSADPHLTRIGNMSMHKILPIQNNMKGVIAQKSKIMYYLDENDWRWRREPLRQKLTIIDNTIVNDLFSTKQYEKQWLRIGDEEVQVLSIDTTTKTATLDKTPTLTGEQSVELGAVLNGYDGTVRVKVPKFYIKAYKDGLIRQVWVSTTQIDDSWTEQPSALIDAYRSTYLNTVPENMGFLSTLKTEEFISVQNDNTYCRGGSNRADRDGMDIFRTDLNKPRTYISMTTLRPKQVDQHILSYFEYKNIFYWLYVIEYANFNSQETFNSDLTSDGFKQGGLGMGVTTIADWNEFNQSNPIIPSGYTNEFGNGTNIKATTLISTSSTTQYVPRWHGIEQPFGDIWTILDGILMDPTIVDTNQIKIYICKNPEYFSSTLTENYKLIGTTLYQDGWIKSWKFTSEADLLIESIGGSPTSDKCDYYYTINTLIRLRQLAVGGIANQGSKAGLSYVDFYYDMGYIDPRYCVRSVSSFFGF